ncbi:MAG: hypothetical protein KBD06_02990 [Candidatus Pacebacteria bacterium]|nr:hypothetical protein [Candidatus Paceibacterota bacterium]
MDADLQPIYDRIMQAIRPEDVFDELAVVLPPRLMEKHLQTEMDAFNALLDADRYTSLDDKEAVALAKPKLDALYATAIERSSKGWYAPEDYTPFVPPGNGRTIVVDGTQYWVGEKFHVGEHSALYKGRMKIDRGSAGVVIRVANTPETNPYVLNEIGMLDQLHRVDVGYWKNVPFMLGRFSSGDRIGLVTRYASGYTLDEVRANKLHRDGLDQRHVVWVMDRMLGLMWYYHSLGIVHGRIDPERIRIRPYNHNALLTGWGHAVFKPAITGQRFTPLGGEFEAPEIAGGGSIGPWTDIYSLGKSLIWLIGGNPITNEMPDRVEPKIRQFLVNMVRKSPKGRPHDARQLYDAQERLKDGLWERQFVHLNMA